MKTSVISSKKAFTLIELLVVIAIIALLMSILMPALAKVREQGKKVRCQAQQRQYGLAISMYVNDNRQEIPFMAAAYTNSAPYFDETTAWYNLVSPYMSQKHVDGNIDSKTGFAVDSDALASVRRCPSGRPNATAYGKWTGWIGVNYGAFTSEHAPFIYGKQPDGTANVPCNMAKVKHPAAWLMLLDVAAWYVFSPASEPYWRFEDDRDGDGLLDTAGMFIYNYAMPRIHNNGCNITLVDGHVEWIAFKEFWKIDSAKNMVCPYWYNK